VYVRRATDPEPVRISDGFPLAISDDGQRAIVRLAGKMLIVPTSGLAQPFDIGEVDAVPAAAWLPDGRMILEVRPKGADRSIVSVRPAAGGPLTPILPAGMFLTPRAVSPDGRRIAAFDAEGRLQVCETPASGLATCRPVAGATADDRIAGWTADSSALLVYRQYPTPIRLERLHIATGRREPVTTLQTATAAVSGVRSMLVTPAGAIFYNYSRSRSVLYSITGVR
jgi:hypothetical protein